MKSYGTSSENVQEVCIFEQGMVGFFRHSLSFVSLFPSTQFFTGSSFLSHLHVALVEMHRHTRQVRKLLDNQRCVEKCPIMMLTQKLLHLL